jgi:hypothetical protein
MKIYEKKKTIIKFVTYKLFNFHWSFKGDLKKKLHCFKYYWCAHIRNKVQIVKKNMNELLALLNIIT